MLLFVDFCDSSSGRPAPSKEHDAVGSDPSNEIDNLLCEFLLALVGMTVGLVGTNSKARVEHQDATLSPRYEQPSLIGR